MNNQNNFFSMLKHRCYPDNLLLIIFLIITDIAIILDTPFIRQILSFILLIFLPGFLLLSLLDLDFLDNSKKIIITVGLSLSFSIIFGLILNTVSIVSGYFQPLTTNFLLFWVNIAFFIFFSLIFIFKKGKLISFHLKNYSITTYLFSISILWISILLAIIGTDGMRDQYNNTILLGSFFLIIFLLIFYTIMNQRITNTFYPITLFAIGLFITLAFSLRSDYIVGVDVHSEYFLFRQTLEFLHWEIINNTALDSCISISLLPGIFQSMMNMGNIALFYKCFFSIIIPFSVVVVYEIARKYLDDIYAFFAGFLFLSSHIFMWTGANPRTNIAILFFVLTILIILLDINKFYKQVLIVIFLLCIIFSHYTTAYIVLFLLVFVWIGLKITHKEFENMGIISLNIIIFYLVMIFFWYSQITKGAFDVSAINFLDVTVQSITDIFHLESRTGAVPEVFGKDFGLKSIPRQIHIFSQWLVILLIFIGILYLIYELLPKVKSKLNFLKTTIFLRTKCDTEFVFLSIGCFIILIFCIAAPSASIELGTDRIFFQMTGILSVVFIIGGIYLAKKIHISPFIVILLILIPYFLCSTGVLYQVFQINNDPTFSSEGYLYHTFYIGKTEMRSANWLFEYKFLDYPIFFFGSAPSNPFMDIKTINNPILLKKVTDDTSTNINGYLYLDRNNVIDNQYYEYYPNNSVNNLSKYSALLNNNGRIYANGKSEVNFI